MIMVLKTRGFCKRKSGASLYGALCTKGRGFHFRNTPPESALGTNGYKVLDIGLL